MRMGMCVVLCLAQDRLRHHSVHEQPGMLCAAAVPVKMWDGSSRKEEEPELGVRKPRDSGPRARCCIMWK